MLIEEADGYDESLFWLRADTADCPMDAEERMTLTAIAEKDLAATQRLAAHLGVDVAHTCLSRARLTTSKLRQGLNTSRYRCTKAFRPPPRGAPTRLPGLEPACDSYHCAAGVLSGADLVEYAKHVLNVYFMRVIRKMLRP